MDSFVFIKEDKEVRLSDSLAEKLAQELSSKFVKFDNSRKRHLKDGETLLKMIDRDAVSDIKYNDLIDTDTMYELKETLKANLRQYMDSHLENFAVLGRDEVSHNNSYAQKEALLYALRDMEFKKESRDILENYLIYGEFIAEIGWQTKVKQVRRKDETENKFVLLNETVYDGPKTENVDSKDFVYDVDCTDFDRALKIRRKHISYEHLLEEKTFNLSKEVKSELKEKYHASTEPNKIELLECWGDVKLSDGTNLKNWLVVIADNKHVIRFEQNPYISNPFVIYQVVKDHETKRGVSPLKVLIAHNLVSSHILTRMMNILELVQNPPMIGPEGLADDTGDIEWEPGRYYAIDNWQVQQMPQPVRFDSTWVDFKFLDYFKSVMQSTSGIFPYMAGIQDDSTRTATEANILVNGQQIRLMLVIEEIQEFLIDIIMKIADLLGNFKLDEENIPIYLKHQLINLNITPDVRQGSYKYDYTDRKGLLQRQGEIDNFVQGLEKFMVAGAPVNTAETFKYWLEFQNIKHPERFVLADKLDVLLNQFPPDMLPQVKNQLADFLVQQMQAMRGAPPEEVPSPANVPPPIM